MSIVLMKVILKWASIHIFVVKMHVLNHLRKSSLTLKVDT